MLSFILIFIYALSGVCASKEACDMEDDIFETRKLNAKQDLVHFSYTEGDDGAHILKIDPLDSTKTPMKIVMCDHSKIVLTQKALTKKRVSWPPIS